MIHWLFEIAAKRPKPSLVSGDRQTAEILDRRGSLQRRLHVLRSPVHVTALEAFSGFSGLEANGPLSAPVKN
jgi:hypothetical protein